MNLFSQKADFEFVKEDEEAVMYHAVKWQSGHRYPLAAMCFHLIQSQQNENS